LLEGAVTSQRLCATVIAVVGWAALALQLGLTLTIVVGQGRTVFDGLWLFIGFFTVLTNILVATSMALVAMGRWPGGPRPSDTAQTGVVLAIAVVGALYYLLLRGHVPELNWPGWIADRTMHYVIPILSVAFWVTFVSKGSFTFKDPFLWMVYPLAYLAYAMARGVIDGWYPYYFIDVGVIGYGRAMLHAALLSFGVLAVGFALVVTMRLLHPVTSGIPTPQD
jgi:hypothetical protein